MTKTIGKIIRVASRRDPLVYLWELYQKVKVLNWQRNGCPANNIPSSIKQEVVKEYAKKFKIDTLIETGTYLSDMVWATKNIFKEIYSIELDDDLFKGAKRRFAKYTHIHIIKGDSAKILPNLLAHISKPCLFWLDAHYSGGITAKGHEETPISIELKHIFSHPIHGHVILIDDAQSFVGDKGYPKIEDLKNYVQNNYAGCIFEVKYGIIRIHSER